MSIPIRNIAIIAHVDHGKTTLVIIFFSPERNFFVRTSRSKSASWTPWTLERERGITIAAKNARTFIYKRHQSEHRRHPWAQRLRRRSGRNLDMCGRSVLWLTPAKAAASNALCSAKGTQTKFKDLG